MYPDCEEIFPHFRGILIEGFHCIDSECFFTDLVSPEPPGTVEPPTTPPLCNEGELRQLSANYSSIRSMYGTFQTIAEFRFEVCTGDQYASICDVGWDDTDAAVICYVLGYPDSSKDDQCILKHSKFQCMH